MKINGLTIVVCEGATPVEVCDVREVHEENVYEEDISEEDVRKVVWEIREVPQNVDIRVTAATVSPIEGGYCLQIWGHDVTPACSLSIPHLSLPVRRFSINTSPCRLIVSVVFYPS